MTLGWLGALYFVVGLICAAAVYERAPRPGARAAGEALLTLLLWPLWAPFALTSPPCTRTRSSEDPIGRHRGYDE